MPPVSQAQRRWAYAVAEGKVKGTPKSVGVEFEGHGVKGLPEHVKHEATSHGTPFQSKKGDGRPTSKPRLKKDHGPTAGEAYNAGGFRGQGGPTSTNQYHTSNP